MTLLIGRKIENAAGYMTAGNKVGFGISTGSMTATWIWVSSMYASATSGYTSGFSGLIHYGLWGALMILFIYPFGKRIRAVAPKAHTLAIGIGMMGIMALGMGIVPLGGDTNNLIPQMAATCLSPVLLGIFLIMIVGALSSAAVSDLPAMSSS
ncbi:MAG: hypothetical protein ABI563_08935 [Specibacter sp.]